MFSNCKTSSCWSHQQSPDFIGKVRPLWQSGSFSLGSCDVAARSQRYEEAAAASVEVLRVELMFATYCLVFEILKFIPMQCKPPRLPVLKEQEQMVIVLWEFSVMSLRKEKPLKLLTCSGLQLCFVVAQTHTVPLCRWSYFSSALSVSSAGDGKVEGARVFLTLTILPCFIKYPSFVPSCEVTRDAG